MTAYHTPDALLRHAPSKIARNLVYLRHFGALNRHEAARLVGDTCLNSTIAVLAINYGLAIQRTPEKVPNRWGEPTDCMRYRLPASEHERADKVLAHMFERSGRTVA